MTPAHILHDRKLMVQGLQGLEQWSVKSDSTGNRTIAPLAASLPRVEERMPVPSLLLTTTTLTPTLPGPHEVLRTGVSVGAGQAVSSHLRGRLMPTVQELL